MNLRTQIICMGCFILLLEIACLSGFYFYGLRPKIIQLESNLVEKDLHRGFELVQRELFHLEHLAKLFTHLPLIEQLVNTSSTPIIQQKLLQEQMRYHEFNLLYVLNNEKEVIWGEIYDLSNEMTFPKLPFLTQLWEENPRFLEHTSLSDIQVWIYNSSLGAMIVVSAPIAKTDSSQIQGTLLIGKLITQDMTNMLQNISYTDVKILPMGGTKLTPVQQNIVRDLQQGVSDYKLNLTGNLIEGYMLLQDLNRTTTLLICTTMPRKFSHAIKISLLLVCLLFMFAQVSFLLILFVLIRKNLLYPAHQLIHEIEKAPTQNHLARLNSHSTNEIGLLTEAVIQLLSREQEILVQKTSIAYREGLYQSRQNLHQELMEILYPLIEGIEITEKNLYNLPINDIEWIIAQGKTGQISLEQLSLYTEKLQVINEKIRQFQKETRNRLYELHSKALRNSAVLRAQTRSLETIRKFTPISKRKFSISGSKSS